MEHLLLSMMLTVGTIVVCLLSRTGIKYCGILTYPYKVVGRKLIHKTES
jgi:hypothetical protein